MDTYEPVSPYMSTDQGLAYEPWLRTTRFDPPLYGCKGVLSGGGEGVSAYCWCMLDTAIESFQCHHSYYEYFGSMGLTQARQNTTNTSV